MSSLRARSLKEILTFTRATVATYCNAAGVLASAAVDEPRIDHDPDTLAVRGLLIEEARTNYLLRSAQFGDATWSKTRATITADSAIAPDGTVTADALIEDSTASNSHFAGQVYTKTSSTEVQEYCLSVWALAASRSKLALIAQGTDGTDYAQCVFDLVAGTAGAVTTAGSFDRTQARIERWPGGWFRCSVNFRINNDGQASVGTIFSLADSAGSLSYSGDGASHAFLWGAQLEKGVHPTSYCATTTAAATRSRDDCEALSMAPWFNEAEGTLFVEYLVPWAYLTGDIGRYLAQVDDDSADNRQVAYLDTGTETGYVAAGGAAQASISGGAVSAGVARKVALGWAANDVALAATGGAFTTDASATMPSGHIHLRVGANVNPGQELNGHLRKLRFYPRRLSDNELRALVA